MSRNARFWKRVLHSRSASRSNFYRCRDKQRLNELCDSWCLPKTSIRACRHTRNRVTNCRALRFQETWAAEAEFRTKASVLESSQERSAIFSESTEIACLATRVLCGSRVGCTGLRRRRTAAHGVDLLRSGVSKLAYSR